jgi:predicted alpha-1,2-mannosidase
MNGGSAGRRIVVAACALAAAWAPAAAWADRAADVNPMIGTSAPGFVFPGASVPFGMVQNSPDTDGSGFAYSGYLYEDPVIRGFSLVHLNGPGVKKGGDLPFFPALGGLETVPTPLTHAREKAEPGYYRIALPQAVVELTASTRAAMQRYTFAPSPDARIEMPFARSIEGVASDFTWQVTGPAEITGSRRGRYPVFTVARFSRPFTAHGTTPEGGWVSFDATTAREVVMRAGVSFVDTAGARRNLEAEAPTFDFDGMRSAARAAWNRELAKVRPSGGLPGDRRVFTTALFHAFQHPNVFEDVDDRYRGRDDAVHVARGRTQYTNFSSWDTYKAQNQLLALTQPARYRDMLLSLLDMARKGGGLPRWAEQSIDPAHMSGDPALPMIADAACRGLLDRPTVKALYDQGVALRARRAPELDALGYLPGNPGTTLEYGVADFALALVADELGHSADAKRLLDASLRYRNVLDPATHWVRPRNADGSWYAPFQPYLDETGFQEGNSWQYSWLAPHDARGLFDRMGGDLAVASRFETFFALPAQAQDKATAFGTAYRLPQYAPGNEHDMQAPWMPAFAGRPDLVADAHVNARTAFTSTVDGLPGNDDLGSLSAWYVWSALGFGPVTPGAPFYVIGSPVLKSVTLSLEDGGTFTVRRKGLGLYVQSARLDGKPLQRSWLPDSAVRDGGTLELRMGPTPSAWGRSLESRPPSASDAPLSAFGCGQPSGE